MDLSTQFCQFNAYRRRGVTDTEWAKYVQLASSPFVNPTGFQLFYSENATQTQLAEFYHVYEMLTKDRTKAKRFNSYDEWQKAYQEEKFGRSCWKVIDDHRKLYDIFKEIINQLKNPKRRMEEIPVTKWHSDYNHIHSENIWTFFFLWMGLEDPVAAIPSKEKMFKNAVRIWKERMNPTWDEENDV